jgi:hypothetical protein
MGLPDPVTSSQTHASRSAAVPARARRSKALAAKRMSQGVISVEGRITSDQVGSVRK